MHREVSGKFRGCPLSLQTFLKKKSEGVPFIDNGMPSSSTIRLSETEPVKTTK
jgi:hypothetical protein